ncbi:MAG: ornithine cyclodeaminase [Pseudomonadota bacterium]
MRTFPFVSESDLEGHWSWRGACDAMRRCHLGERAIIGDTLLQEEQNSLLCRSAWLPNIACGTKIASVFPDNDRIPPGRAVQSVCILFDPYTGETKALVDGNLVTRIKTAADSALGAELLARSDSEVLTILGAGVVARSVIDAYGAIFPTLRRIQIWNRTFAKAERLAQSFQSTPIDVVAIEEIEEAVSSADIVSSATMAKDPLIKGDWIRPGTHVDLIGAFTPDMREADDQLMQCAEIFVDAKETTIEDIGELKIPISRGVIKADDVRGDFYDLCRGHKGRSGPDAVTVFKNGGGGHLDLMIGMYLLSRVQS